MKIAVLGAGALGSVLGACLVRGGTDVTLLDVNDEHLEAIRTNGLRVTMDNGTERFNLPAMRPVEYAGSPDIVFLCTKAFQTDQALASIAKALQSATVLTLQNGIGNAERILRHVPQDRVLIGTTITPGDYLGAGRVASHGTRSVKFYSLDGMERMLLSELADVMIKGGIETRVDPDIQVAIWEKAAFNCAMNALGALTDAPPGAIGACPDGRALASRAVAEAIAVATASGINAKLARVEVMMDYAATHHPRHSTSMLQDRRAGRKTEVESLNGAVSRIGAELGVAVPVNDTLAALIRLTESANVFHAQDEGLP